MLARKGVRTGVSRTNANASSTSAARKPSRAFLEFGYPSVTVGYPDVVSSAAVRYLEYVSIDD